MTVSLASLAAAQSKQQILSDLLSALQGVGQITQAGAAGGPAQGLGNLAISGVPTAAYTVLVQVQAGGATSALSILYSLDGGQTWTPAAIASAESPWALLLTDYRSAGSATGLTLTFSDGPISADSWVAGESYSFPTFVPNYPLSDFYSGSAQRTILEADAQVTSDWTATIAQAIAGGFTGLASLPWLVLLAEELYGLQWKQATSTQGQVLLADVGGAGPFPIQQAQLWFAAISGNLYQLATTGAATLPKSTAVMLSVQAQAPGATYDDLAASISSAINPQALLTSLPGVQILNPVGCLLGAQPWQPSQTWSLGGVPPALGGVYGYAHAVGDLVKPPGGNGYVYLAIAVAGLGIPGTAGPAWPTQIGQTVVDNAGANQITWMCFGVDGTEGNYVQATASVAPGSVYAQVKKLLNYPPTAGTQLAFSPTPSAAAQIVVRVVGSTGPNDAYGYLGQAEVAVSTDGGLTFGGGFTLGQQDSGGANLTNWQASYGGYVVNSEVAPVTKNGYWFKAKAATGASGAAEPNWALAAPPTPTAAGGTVADGGVTWQNMGLIQYTLAINGGGSGGPNLGGTVNLFFVDGATGPSFLTGDSYLFDTDWASQYGSDAETSGQLAVRCQQQWATLAMGIPIAEIEAWAKAASPEVLVATASPDPGGTGQVDLYLAGSNAGVSQAAVVAVSSYVQARLPVGSVVSAASAQVCTVTLAGTVYCKAGLIAAAQQQLAAALGAYGRQVGVGNAASPATIELSAVIALIQNQPGVRNVDNAAMSTPAGGTVSAAGDLTLAAGYFAGFAAVTTPLNWQAI